LFWKACRNTPPVSLTPETGTSARGLITSRATGHLLESQGMRRLRLDRAFDQSANKVPLIQSEVNPTRIVSIDSGGVFLTATQAIPPAASKAIAIVPSLCVVAVLAGQTQA
jgi:hypothetical protein